MSATGRKRYFPREGPSTDEYGDTKAARKWEVPFYFCCLRSCRKSRTCQTLFHLQKFPHQHWYFSLDHSSSPRFAWKMTWMLLCRHVSIVLIDSVVICILIYNDIFIFHEHLLWKNYIVIGWILFLSK